MVLTRSGLPLPAEKDDKPAQGGSPLRTGKQRLFCGSLLSFCVVFLFVVACLWDLYGFVVSLEFLRLEQCVSSFFSSIF